MDRFLRLRERLLDRAVLRERVRLALGQPGQRIRGRVGPPRYFFGEYFDCRVCVVLCQRAALISLVFGAGCRLRQADPLRQVRVVRMLRVREAIRLAIDIQLEGEPAVRRWRVRPTFTMRQQWGAWYTIIPFMREHDPEKYFNFLRMTPAMFDELLARVRPHLERRAFEAQVLPAEKLALTLRYVIFFNIFLNIFLYSFLGWGWGFSLLRVTRILRNKFDNVILFLH